MLPSKNLGSSLVSPLLKKSLRTTAKKKTERACGKKAKKEGGRWGRPSQWGKKESKELELRARKCLLRQRNDIPKPGVEKIQVPANTDAYY